MLVAPSRTSRRSFLASSAASVGALAASLPGLAQTATPQAATPQPPTTTPPAKLPPLPLAPPYDRETINLLGPKPGYSPMIGVLVSQLT